MHARQALCMRPPLSTGVTIRDLPAASCVGAAPVDDRGCASCWPGVTPGVLWRGPRSCARGPSASRTGVVSLAGDGSDRPEIPTPSARDFPGGDPTYPPWRPTGHVATALHVWCACAMHATAVARAPCHACGPRRAGDRHSPVARAGSGRRHAPPRTDRGLRDSPSTSLRAGHRWSRPAHKIAFFRSMVTSVLD